MHKKIYQKIIIANTYLNVHVYVSIYIKKKKIANIIITKLVRKGKM